MAWKGAAELAIEGAAKFNKGISFGKLNKKVESGVPPTKVFTPEKDPEMPVIDPYETTISKDHQLNRIKQQELNLRDPNTDWLIEQRKLDFEVKERSKRKKIDPVTGQPMKDEKGRNIREIEYDRTKLNSDKLPSLESTGPEILFGDKRIYNLSSEKRAEFNKYEAMVEDSPALQLHHKFMKSISAPFFRRAKELGASDADILNLHYLALERGVGAGDRLSALLPMAKVPHEILHDLMLKTGIQPSASKISYGMGPATKPAKLSKADWKTVKKAGVQTEADAEEFMAWAEADGEIDIERGLQKFNEAKTSGRLRRRRPRPGADSELKRYTNVTEEVNNITELTEAFDQAITDIAEPMTREAQYLQEAWDTGIDTPRKERFTKLRIKKKKLNSEVKTNKSLQSELTQVTDEYNQLKKELIADLLEEREEFGFLIDDLGNLDPDTTGELPGSITPGRSQDVVMEENRFDQQIQHEQALVNQRGGLSGNLDEVGNLNAFEGL